MVRIQKVQRQERRCTITPPKRGPRVGPSRGPSRYQPKTLARWLGSNMSLREPPPLAMPTLPKKPARVRMAMRVPMLGARAEGIWRRAKMEKQLRYITLLPKVSLRGACT